MDVTDLKQSDPKRVGLEQDRIVLEYMINQFRSQLVTMHSSINDLLSAAASEKRYLAKLVYLYKAEQMKILQALIEIYEDDYNRLLKEDSL